MMASNGEVGRFRTLWRRTAIGFFGVVALLLGTGVLAWACTVESDISVDPRSGSAGSAVTVTGENYPKEGTIEIRWNSVDGEVLGTTSGANFSTTVNIPDDARAGDNYVVAVSPPDDQGRQYRATASFTVATESSDTSSDGETSTSSGSEDEETTSSGEASETTSGAEDSEDSTSNETNESSETDTTSEGEETSSTDTAPSTEGDADTATESEAGTEQESTRPPTTENETATTPASANESVVTSDEGREVFGGSVASTGTTDEADGQPVAAGLPGGVVAESGTPDADGSDGSALLAELSERAGTGELWSGSNGSAEERSLVDAAMAEATPDRLGTYLAVGAGLLGVGLVALFAALTIGLVRREPIRSEADQN